MAIRGPFDSAEEAAKAIRAIARGGRAKKYFYIVTGQIPLPRWIVAHTGKAGVLIAVLAIAARLLVPAKILPLVQVTMTMGAVHIENVSLALIRFGDTWNIGHKGFEIHVGDWADWGGTSHMKALEVRATGSRWKLDKRKGGAIFQLLISEHGGRVFTIAVPILGPTFAFDKADAMEPADGQTELANAFVSMALEPMGNLERIAVVGHTDPIAGVYNRGDLSLDRAQWMYDHFISPVLGIRRPDLHFGDEIQTFGHGWLLPRLCCFNDLLEFTKGEGREGERPLAHFFRVANSTVLPDSERESAYVAVTKLRNQLFDQSKPEVRALLELNREDFASFRAKKLRDTPATRALFRAARSVVIISSFRSGS